MRRLSMSSTRSRRRVRRPARRISRRPVSASPRSSSTGDVLGGAASSVRVRPSSGNVFRDLGFGPEEAENLRLRADLMIELHRILEGGNLTQAQAAKLLGVTQPRISDLVRGKINLFSVDTLVSMLGRAGFHVTLGVHRRARVG